jgi:hypothetical protein
MFRATPCYGLTLWKPDVACKKSEEHYTLYTLDSEFRCFTALGEDVAMTKRIKHLVRLKAFKEWLASATA